MKIKEKPDANRKIFEMTVKELENISPICPICNNKMYRKKEIIPNGMNPSEILAHTFLCHTCDFHWVNFNIELSSHN